MDISTEANPARRRITVVTVVLNQVETIERTLSSVIEQDYPDLEYLVIDGGSTDGTLDVIRRHKSGITQWISGKDGGPYGAMNKGAAMASGEWVAFMNGGDVYVQPDAISRAFAASASARLSNMAVSVRLIVSLLW